MDPDETDRLFDLALGKIAATTGSATTSKSKKTGTPNTSGGNPEFGISIKRERIFEEPLAARVTIRLTKEQKKLLDRQPTGFARQAILKALGIWDNL